MIFWILNSYLKEKY